MITDADTKKLLTAFKKVFPTKESLKEDLNDMRSQIMESMDGKLKATERNIFEAVDEKLAVQGKVLLKAMDAKLEKQTDEIVTDVVKTIVPLIDEHDVRIAALEKQRPLIPS